MLTWAIIFLIIAIIAAIFGFKGIATTAAQIAKILFFIFLVLFVITLIFGLLKQTQPVERINTSEKPFETTNSSWNIDPHHQLFRK